MTTRNGSSTSSGPRTCTTCSAAQVSPSAVHPPGRRIADWTKPRPRDWRRAFDRPSDRSSTTPPRRVSWTGPCRSRPWWTATHAGCSGSSTTAWSPVRGRARATSGRRDRDGSRCASWTTSVAPPPKRSGCAPSRDSEPRDRCVSRSPPEQPQAVCSSTARHAASKAASISAVASESVLAMEIRPNCARPISWGACPSSHSGSSNAR